MRYISLINGTASADNHTVEIFNILLFVETFFICLSYIIDGMSIYFIVTLNYHPNLVLLLKNLYLQYFVQMFARLIQIYKMIDLTDEHLSNDIVFSIASFIRNCLLFIALYFALFITIERLWATYYMNDYERKHRLHIGYAITLIMLLWSVCSSIVFILELLSLWYHIISLFVSNITAFLICVYLGYYNNKQYNKIFSSISCEESPYSLSQRYQIVENIKTVIFFKKVIICITIFSVLCGFLISAELISQNANLKNWMQMGFNYACISYGLTVPFLIHCQDPTCAEETKKSLKRVFGKNVSVDADLSKKPIRDRYGHNLIKTKEEERNIYFNNITRDWTVGPPHGRTTTNV